MRIQVGIRESKMWVNTNKSLKTTVLIEELVGINYLLDSSDER